LNSLVNFLRAFIPVSPFNDFQGLTDCLKNGVHSNFFLTLFASSLLPVRWITLIPLRNTARTSAVPTTTPPPIKPR